MAKGRPALIMLDERETHLDSSDPQTWRPAIGGSSSARRSERRIPDSDPSGNRSRSIEFGRLRYRLPNAHRDDCLLQAGNDRKPKRMRNDK
jgi:hypothetical protein